jgi:phosphate/sulfate permease
VFWEAVQQLAPHNLVFFALALAIAFGFEFINGFHDTANAVTTVIYTRTLKATPAVVYSGVCNFVGVMLGGTAVAFSIVNLLPVNLLVESDSVRSVVMVVSLLLAGVIWNLATWWYGLPVSSSHTLIGSILGVGLTNSLITRGDVTGVNWAKAGEVGLSLLISPAIGFAAASGLLLAMKRVLKEPRLYEPPADDDRPPHWVRGVLLATCGGVSLAHGSNDGQKGMGLILLVLIGFLPSYYALDLRHGERAQDVREAAIAIRQILDESAPAAAVLGIRPDVDAIIAGLEPVNTYAQITASSRWEIREAIFRVGRAIDTAELPLTLREAIAQHRRALSRSIEYVPAWVILGVALALGGGTMIGYKRIVVTVAEKIGKSHLTYAQGAAAEVVAAVTIGLADVVQMPVSTTHVLSSGVAGTMWANQSGLRSDTIQKIGLVWVTTVPAAILLSAALFGLGGLLVPAASSASRPPAVVRAPEPSQPPATVDERRRPE